MFWWVSTKRKSRSRRSRNGRLQKSGLHLGGPRHLQVESLETRTLLDAGGLDSTFGNGGMATTAIGTQSWASSVTVEPDGKIVAAGTAQVGGEKEFAIARYNADGTLDKSFGNDGVVTTAIGTDSQAFALAVQTDGNIVVVGQAFDGSRVDFALARYNDNGVLDASFGQGGVIMSTLGTVGADAYSVAIQRDGKIVVGGNASNSFAVARYLSDGTLDTSFGNDGATVLTGVQGNPEVGMPSGITIESDGKILAVSGGSDLMRFNVDGTLDGSFGSNGIVQLSGGKSWDAQAVVVQPDGKILVGGSFTTKFAPQPKPPAPPGVAQNDIEIQDPAYVWFGVVRYNADGSLDTSFGNGGVVTTQVAGGGDVLHNLLLEPDGRIVAAGGAEINPDGSNPQGALAAVVYNADGSLDTGFANGGVFYSSTGATQGGGMAAALDGDGNVVISGGAGNDGQQLSFAVARVITSVGASSAGTSATTLVEQLYQQLLGRSADPAGLEYWTSQAAQGTTTATIAADFVLSAEYLQRAIGLDYQQLLHRVPDAQGLGYFMSAVERGQMDLNEVVVNIATSNEFVTDAGTSNVAWIDSLYVHVLGRSPDPASSAYWANEFQTLTAQQVATMFVYSQENVNREVVAWYESLLGRVPTTDEVAKAAAILVSGQGESAVLAEIVATN